MVAADRQGPRARAGNRADLLLDDGVAFFDADGRCVDIADVGDVQPIERRDLLKKAV